MARLKPGAKPQEAQRRLSETGSSFGPYEVWTADAFARRSQRYWILDTGAGAGVLFMAVIVCLVGAIVTSQSLKAVVAGSAREYAVLNALGVSRASLGRVVVEQACWIGGLGFVLAALTSVVLLSCCCNLSCAGGAQYGGGACLRHSDRGAVPAVRFGRDAQLVACRPGHPLR